jgi:hypothetical protein
MLAVYPSSDDTLRHDVQFSASKRYARPLLSLLATEKTKNLFPQNLLPTMSVVLS